MSPVQGRQSEREAGHDASGQAPTAPGAAPGSRPAIGATAPAAPVGQPRHGVSGPARVVAPPPGAAAPPKPAAAIAPKPQLQPELRRAPPPAAVHVARPLTAGSPRRSGTTAADGRPTAEDGRAIASTKDGRSTPSTPTDGRAAATTYGGPATTPDGCASAAPCAAAFGGQEVSAGCSMLIVNRPDPRPRLCRRRCYSRHLRSRRRYSDRAISTFMISLVPP